MPSPASSDEFLDLVRKSGVLDERKLSAYLGKLWAASAPPKEPLALANALVQEGLLTRFQAEQILQGKWRRFFLGKYKVLERLGTGGMGSVYLCEHKVMRHHVAVKVLSPVRAEDRSARERFYREARALAALDHPNIVRGIDIDEHDNLHFLVMEYIDGSSFQALVQRDGPMDIARACQYISQVAQALQYAYTAAGLVHRDIKPSNLLVDRHGRVKVLDLGLARFCHDQEDDLTRQLGQNVLGTADYLAPEQALDSRVDIRADIYSLGNTFYFCLTGRTPFPEGKPAQKLIWQQTRRPKPIRWLRPVVPEELAAVIEKMIAKQPRDRYQTPQDVVEALAPWTREPVPPPSAAEMLHLCRAAQGAATGRPLSVRAAGEVVPAPCGGLPVVASTRGINLLQSATRLHRVTPARAGGPKVKPKPPPTLLARTVSAASTRLAVSSRQTKVAE
jgi:predicted Ser/Thr protein kinase